MSKSVTCPIVVLACKQWKNLNEGNHPVGVTGSIGGVNSVLLLSTLLCSFLPSNVSI